MCGIAGFYNSNQDFSSNQKKSCCILKNMINNMKHRGPDGDGYTIINSCCLAHTRLAIIDLDTGDQPFKVKYNNANFYIVYNGEIYNYLKLKNELINQGFSFKSKSDTEVILYAYIHYGPGFVDKLNGIFSMAIYDESQKKLLLYRDRFGIKPLYYANSNGTTVFASRIDTLFEYPGIRPAVDINSLNEIFTIGPAKTYGKGVFLGINEVLPGEFITISPQFISKKFYYTIKSVPHTDNYEDTVQKTKWLIEDSVKMQMLSDVPICTFLSGGIDSSIVSSICHKYTNTSLSTYSFDFDGNTNHFKSNNFQPSEDKPYVDIMKNYLNSNHKYLYCNSDKLYSLLECSVDSRCLPTMADIDSSLLYFCSEVSYNHKVALTGECADEIFGGYPWFHNEEMIYAGTFPWMRDISFRKSMLNADFSTVLNMENYIKMSYNNTISEVEILPYENALETSRRKISYLNIKWFMQTLLDRMDRTSMYSGLEARVPFADHRIVDYIYNVPWEYKCKNNIPKSLLRAASKDFLPEKILNRPKNPYPKTYNPDYEKKLSSRLKEIINDYTSPIRGYLNIKEVNKFIDEPKEYGKPWYGQLMAGPQMMAYLIQIDYWMRKYSLSI